MNLDPNAIADFVQKVTVTGIIIIAFVASYRRMFLWAWQVDERIAEKDKVIAERDARIVQMEAMILGYKDREDKTNEEYRRLAWDAIRAAQTASSVGREIIGAARENRGR